MNIYCYRFGDNVLDLEGVCDKWFEVLWTQRFFKGGEFKLTLPPTAENLELFREGNVIELEKTNPKTGRNEHAGIITSVSLTAGERAVLTVSGQDFVGMLERRVLSEYELDDTSMTILRKNAGDLAKPSKRSFAATEFDVSSDFAGYKFGGMLFGTLANYVSTVAADKGWGVYSWIRHDKSGCRIVISGRNSTNRSVTQPSAVRAIFSDEQDTAADFERQHSDSGSVTGVVVGSKKQYNDASHIDIDKYTDYFGDAQSYGRIEEFQNITPVTKIEIRGKDDEWTILDEWETFLAADELAAGCYVTATDYFDASIVIRGSWEEKFAVGDTVTIQNTAWNMSTDRQVTEIREYWGADSVTVTATLGEPQKTLAEILKKG